MEKVWSSNINKNRLEFHLSEKGLIIKKNEMSTELIQPPVTANLKFQSLKDFYSFLVSLPHEKMFIVHQYVFIDVAGELITIKLRHSNNQSEQNIQIRLIEASIGKLFLNQEKAKRINYNSGFLNDDVQRKGNCMGIILSIYQARGQGKRYILSFNTCYFIAFNIAIFNDEKLRNADLTLEYSCVLVSTFQDETARYEQPMVEYGKIKGIVRGSHFIICDIKQNQEVFQDVGYLPLKFVDQIQSYIHYEYSKHKNQRKYGSRFWSYDLYRLETRTQEIRNKMNAISITNGLYLNTKNKSFIENALSQLSQPQYKISQDLFAKMEIYYNKIHLISHNLIDEQLAEEKDNDILERNISVLVRQREEIYYRLGKFEAKYFMSLDNKEKQIYQLKKQERLNKYSQDKARQYGRLFDERIGTKLRISEHIVHRQEKNYDSLPRSRRIIDKMAQTRKTSSLSYILESQVQFREQHNNFIQILKDMQKKPFVQTYLFNAFYKKYNKKIVELKLPQLLRVDCLVKSSCQNPIHTINKAEINCLSGKKDIKFTSSKNTNFFIRNEMEYSLSYEDKSYIYSLDIDILNCSNKKLLLHSLNLDNLEEVYKYFQTNLGKIKIFLAEGIMIIDDKKIIGLKRFKKPIVTECQDYPLIILEKGLQIKENIKQNWKSKKTERVNEASTQF